MRVSALLLFFFASTSLFASNVSEPSAPPASPSVHGDVADPSGAIVPGAEIDLVDASGAVAGTGHSTGDGSFQIAAPHTGSYTLVVSEPGFETIHSAIVIPASVAGAPSAQVLAAPLHIVLPIAALATNVHVSADTSEDLASTEDNHDASVLTSSDLKQLPIFDNDYATAMSAFLDDSATATGGSGLIVDGVEAQPRHGLRIGRPRSSH